MQTVTWAGLTPRPRPHLRRKCFSTCGPGPPSPDGTRTALASLHRTGRGACRGLAKGGPAETVQAFAA